MLYTYIGRLSIGRSQILLVPRRILHYNRRMDTPELRPWKTLSRRIILQYGKFLTVEQHEVELPDGQVIPDWTLVSIPDAAIILAETANGQYVCFRQTKYALEGVTLAPAAGMLEPGEDPLQGAKRELLEETGYTAAEWIHLGSYRSDPNRGVNIVHLYLACWALPGIKPASDDLEDQQLVLLSRSELLQALQSGEFKALMWAACIALALLYR